MARIDNLDACADDNFMPEPPPGQAAPVANDLFVDRQGIIYLTDRRKGGLYVLEYSGALG